jgi:hypothetical protein
VPWVEARLEPDDEVDAARARLRKCRSSQSAPGGRVVFSRLEAYTTDCAGGNASGSRQARQTAKAVDVVVDGAVAGLAVERSP